MDLPYMAEYSKSSRATCRGCKSGIAKDVLRLAVLVQSPVFDGKVTQWYHHACFFSSQRPKTVDDIAHFESLRWKDQEFIKSKIVGGSVILPETKGKKRNAVESTAKKSALKDYVIEYAKSSRAMCRGCEQKIMKDEIRISKKDYETDAGKRYGGQDMWHHVSCFTKLRAELGYFECGDKLPGYKALNKNDQQEVKKELAAIKQEVVENKKPKVEDETDGDTTDNSLEKKMKTQNTIIFKYRDQLKELSKKELQELLTSNNQEIPAGIENILDLLSDIMTFGALDPCNECSSGGQFVFNKFGYMCQGNLTEWSKCTNTIKEPKRSAFVVPSTLKKHSFLKKYKYIPRTRIIKDVQLTVKKEEDNEGPKIKRERPPLYNMEFVLLGNLDGKKDSLKKEIVKLGGKVTTKIKETVMAVISTVAEVEKMGSRIMEASNADVHVVSADFVDAAKDYCGRIPELVLDKNICTWGSNPHTRLPPEPSTSNLKSSRFTSSMPTKVKLKLKGGGAVDPDSGLEDCAHVYQSGKDKYNAVLGLTDIQQQQNKFYKLQILETDHGSKYWVFRSWGRIGTTIGGNKLEAFNLDEAKQKFCQLYKERTGNNWNDRENFKKIPGHMYPIDIDYGEEEAELKLNADVNNPSKLAKPIQDLIQLIFDVNSMKKLMLEFELDTEKMPLGKLSKTQLQNAYKVLTELQEFVESKAPLSRLIDASNRFYTFVPHSFGIAEPPVIDNVDIIKKKIEMIDNLMELEVAYTLMKSTGGFHTIDDHYDKLNTEIDILSHESEEYEIIKQYIQNTHAETHSNYELEIQDVFTIKRNGEEKRYKPFRKLHNRKLLWHGSRTTNYAGILSQGLRIAPPEAPVTGYMFGKGIYFADMVSKSANYCFTAPNNDMGLMLLCEVALGDTYELYKAKYVEKLPKGKHSVKGMGRTEPDPKHISKLKNGVEVPIGKGVVLDRPDATLLYNEYIVYDVAQVNIKYLLKLNFKYKY